MRRLERARPAERVPESVLLGVCGGLAVVSSGTSATSIGVPDRAGFSRPRGSMTRRGAGSGASHHSTTTCTTVDPMSTAGRTQVRPAITQPGLPDTAILPSMRFVARILGIAVFALLLPFVGAAFGRGGALAGAGLGVLAILWLWLWLPRSAHEAFESGKYKAAVRRYRILGFLAATTSRERAALLSRAGCAVAENNLELAERLLAAIDAGALAAAERAVWLNNRACATLAAKHDPSTALALVDEASALRPDVPALQHTRGMALLAVGRIDDAIAVLDGMRAGGELPARLEADRCRELARAWSQKGETAYAEDYRLRAEALAR